jgi:hypothetical protein
MFVYTRVVFILSSLFDIEKLKCNERLERSSRITVNLWFCTPETESEKRMLVNYREPGFHIFLYRAANVTFNRLTFPKALVHI